MTLEDAVMEITRTTSLTLRDVQDLLACSEGELEVLVVAYRDSGVMPTASAWDSVLDVLKVVGEVAAFVIPLTGAICGVYAVTRLGK